jgi:hypothetical protein
VEPLYIGSLHNNGAIDPDRWAPSYDNCDRNRRRLQEGDLVAWRYGAWRVIETRVVDDADLSDRSRRHLYDWVGGFAPEARESRLAQARPQVVVLCHESGPLLLKPSEANQTLHDGRRTIHFRSWPHRHTWNVLAEPYKTCSCHGHIWPCQEIDRAALAAHDAAKMDRLMATAQPGVCAHCLEPVSTRQKFMTFPEPSLFVPGAPGPTFHAGRGACWAAAEEYERGGRLADDPDVVRLASCPGIRFIHEAHGMPADRRLECTAGPLCTGLHGPPGHRREPPCWHVVQLATNEGAYARPTTDCGYRQEPDRRCLGSDLSSSAGGINAIAADLLWETRRRAKQRIQSSDEPDD